MGGKGGENIGSGFWGENQQSLALKLSEQRTDPIRIVCVVNFVSHVDKNQAFSTSGTNSRNGAKRSPKTFDP